jgi:CRISPR system Cascade subunit CasA
MTTLSPTAPPCRFNLWQQPWIRVTRDDGTPAELGIGDCLAQAHRLYALHDPSPLVVGGTHRLLTALLQALYAPEALDDIEDLLDAGQFDPARLDAFAAQYGERFELFHPTTPFLQTGDVPLESGADTGKLKTVAELFNEVPGATYRAHFSHVTDDSHQVCPACCARGVVTVPTFASSGGASIYPSINGVPPVYVFPTGDTLFQALVLSLTTPGYQPAAADTTQGDVACWTMESPIAKNHEVTAVGYLESLTFPARQMRLFPVAERATCTHCGDISDVTVQRILFAMGHRRPKGATTWDDPFVAFVPPSSGAKRDAAGMVAVRPQEGKALWREYSGLLLTHAEHAERQPKIVRQMGALVNRTVLRGVEQVRFRCIGLRTDGKGKFFEWLDEALDVPPALLNDPDGTLIIDTALRRADDAEKVMSRVFYRHFRPERERDKPVKKEVARFHTLHERMQTMFWERLAPEFFAFVRDAANPEQRDAAERRWIDTLVQVGSSTFNETADQAGDRADALRARVEAQAECARRLYAKRKEWRGDD